MTSMLLKTSIVTRNADETQALGARLAQRLEPGDVLWLSGDLGAGKTTFTQGLGRGLGIAAPINSPTFVLIREYVGRLPLYHIDLYRLDGAREVAALGLSDYLAGDGVCVLEWAERLDARGELPGLHIHIEQVPAPDVAMPSDEAASMRRLTLAAAGERAEQLLSTLREDTLTDAARY